MKINSIEVCSRWGLIPEGGDITQGKQTERKMSPKLFDKYLTSGHSPLRRLDIAVIVEAPTEPISHLVRHVHAVHFVQTGREDLTGVKRDHSADRLYLLQANPQEWVQISHDRLCKKAADTTRELVWMIRHAFETHEDKLLNVLGMHMEPSCCYLGACKEVFGSCGRYGLKKLKGYY